ncbi:hypothetical protein EPUS_04301 [Endocarpon pusillum Z07020]|uniref:dihydroneopterin aldolase n=1 Tax=Endocarpon pusillum (strain Z07020 / HMAS-L-300199) TaxID=1263415 RepID=U1I2M9_ENDPU|nr:uncharacterized protein EPUS_04301 [Endocarpon pusillum Z07020]ERF76224.1 hypothetical protein EPUS_04301 [Endocarpon pusillum Z07020]
MDVNTVFLKDMPFMLSVGKDAWNRENKPQPVSITLRVNNVKSIHDVAASDDISQSLDYGKLYKNIQSKLGNPGGHDCLSDIAKQVLAAVEVPETSSSVEVVFPKAALRAEGGLRSIVNWDKDRDVTNVYQTLQILGIKCACVIGVNPHERREKQIVVVNLTFRSTSNTKEATAVEIALDNYHEIIEMVVKFIEGSSYQTVETLANLLCKQITMQWDISEAEVSVEKPYAIPSIGAAGVCIRRRRSFYEKTGFWKVKVQQQSQQS